MVVLLVIVKIIVNSFRPVNEGRALQLSKSIVKLLTKLGGYDIIGAKFFRVKYLVP